MAPDGHDEAPPGEVGPDGFKVVTGGQTGVDRAALDAALDAGVPCGGWCPAGRAAEDGPLPARYPLTETPEADPAFRTRRNVADADGTLVIVLGAPDGGTRAALAAARRLGRPCLTVDLAEMTATAARGRVSDWIAREGIRILNIAGPRESSAPGIYGGARALLTGLFADPTPRS